jgi:hypothetical protein
MAAGVYGSSEGLKVLVVERCAAGGQAGTSPRIENYLGFPEGISGEDLTGRGFKQATQFGAEVALTRSMEKLTPSGEGHVCELDGGQSVSARAGREVAAHTEAHKGDFLRINTRQSECEVDHRGDDLLPVRTKRQAFAMNRPILAWAVEGQHISATLDTGPCTFTVHLFC